MTISVIVPVYKVEAYLRQCVESLTCQTYSDIEIILVDDGSPDGSPALCDQLATEDSRIRVVHKENGGLSDARNAGLRVAVGEYVVFCDSDDFWDNANCMQQLVNEITACKNVDFIGFNFKKYYEDTGVFKLAPMYSEATITSKDKNNSLYSLAKQGVFPISACTKLIRREFLIENNLYFIRGLISEDIPWYIDVISKANKCKYINLYAYVYRQNVSGSITNAFSEKKFFDRINIIEKEASLVESRNLDKHGKEALYYFLAYEYTQFIANIGRFDGQKRNEVLGTLKQYQWLLKYDLNYKVRIPRYVCKLFGLENTARLVKLYNSIRR